MRRSRLIRKGIWSRTRARLSLSLSLSLRALLNYGGSLLLPNLRYTALQHNQMSDNPMIHDHGHND